MELYKVSKDSDHKRIRKLYSEAFPLPERAPLRLLIKKAEQGKAEFWEMFDGDIG